LKLAQEWKQALIEGLCYYASFSRCNFFRLKSWKML